MREFVIIVLSLILAGAGWWGVNSLTANVRPDQPGARVFFLALLSLALTGTLAPLVTLLNRRFSPQAYVQDPWRVFRHSVWAALCLVSWTWLQMLRALNVAFALIIAMIFVALEVLILRLRGGP
jgi:hypothetical protein